MLTIFGKGNRNGGFCDRQTRRDFLTIGGSILGGLALPQLLRAEAEQGQGAQHKAIINIYLPGGPPHQDMWDIKTEAPKEIRGEFNPIATNVTGIQIGETFKRIAKSADKFAFIRSVVGAKGGQQNAQRLSAIIADGHSARFAPPRAWLVGYLVAPRGTQPIALARFESHAARLPAVVGPDRDLLAIRR